MKALDPTNSIEDMKYRRSLDELAAFLKVVNNFDTVVLLEFRYLLIKKSFIFGQNELFVPKVYMLSDFNP